MTETLFIGSAANYAAKIIDPTVTSPCLTQRMKDVLSEAPPGRCFPVKPGLNIRAYSIRTPDQYILTRLLQAHGIRWRPAEVRQRLQQEKQGLLSKPITMHAGTPLKNLHALSIHNNRRVFAASFFADISGFTRYIERSEKAAKQVQALRVLHVIREEMASIVRLDFPGLRIQFQGDRIQALFVGEEQSVAQCAVDAAIGLQSAMEGPIKKCLPQAAPLHLAIGIDLGVTLVSRLGVHKYRDPICLGQAVEHAAAFEEASEAGQIAVSRRLRRSLPEDMKSCFQRDRESHCFVASDMTTLLKLSS